MLTVFTCLMYYEITLVSLGNSQASVLKSCIVSVKTVIFQRDKTGISFTFLSWIVESFFLFQKLKRTSGKGCVQ